ncbi:MAG TPA: ABC transporter substrate-binding protein, partial [Lachnospiraceae bacterium]|nr:ABC transporter substrate-binding protein [Lachnospiraceae bacterium]
MEFKKLISIGLSLVMIVSAAGCGGATGAATSGGDTTAAEAVAAEPAA